MVTHLDDPHELDIVEPHIDLDVVMLRLDIALAADGDRHQFDHLYGFARSDLLVDPDGTVRYA